MDELAPPSLLSIADEYGTKIPESVRKLIEAGEEIANNPLDPTVEKIIYNHSILCIVNFPRRPIQERIYERRCGPASILIKAGELWDGHELVPQEMPFGPMSRLLLMHIGSLAKRTKSRTVNVGKTAATFLLNMRLATGGREYQRLRRHMDALLACSLTLGYGQKTVKDAPIEEIEGWTSTKQRWNGHITLSEKFYHSFFDHAVPLDPRALERLSKSALGLDIYAWLAYRLHQLDKDGMHLTWGNLEQQFGQEYRDLKNFKREFKRTLSVVRAVYPTASIKAAPWGIILLPSPPPLSREEV